MPTLFSRIIQGEIPSVKILEDERYCAFLDIHPINPGHTLVVPKVEVDELFEVPADVLAGMLPFAQKVAKALKKSVPCVRIGVIVAGMEVPHAHMHLVPINGERELDFSRAKAAQPEELKTMGATIRGNL
jgi:histidine triad (HIT) family protein